MTISIKLPRALQQTPPQPPQKTQREQFSFQNLGAQGTSGVSKQVIDTNTKSLIFSSMGTAALYSARQVLWSGKEQANTHPQHRRHHVTDPGSICGLPKLLDLDEKRILTGITPLCVNRKLQEQVTRSRYSAPLSAGSPLKQHEHEEGIRGLWGHMHLDSNHASFFYFACGHGTQLIKLSDPLS